jgi:hypothetical protein
MTITLSDGTQLAWNGSNDGGQVVTNGQYFIEIRSNDGQGGDATVVKEVTVVRRGPDIPAGDVLVYPDPDHAGTDGTQIHFAAAPNPPVTLKVDIYTVAGELVQRVEGAPGASQATWDFTGRGIASGLYIAAVEVVDAGGSTARHLHKVVILH